MNPNPPIKLLPGDILLYEPSGIFGVLIALKTWNRVSHVETYIGNGRSVASRDGIGVNWYPLRTEGLCVVRRPMKRFNLKKALAWQAGVNGQKYDWRGILVFTLAVKEGSPNKMFCSEHATRFARVGGIAPFAPDYDADRVAPANFLTSPAYVTVWDGRTTPKG